MRLFGRLVLHSSPAFLVRPVRLIYKSTGLLAAIVSNMVVPIVALVGLRMMFVWVSSRLLGQLVGMKLRLSIKRGLLVRVLVVVIREVMFV